MSPVLVVAVLAALVSSATALGFVWRFQQGRVRRPSGQTVIRAGELPGIAGFGHGATLLQFSTEICAPCVATRRVLGVVAAGRGDVTHVDLDLTGRPDLATKFNILQTPTTFILDNRGVVRARIGGAPRVAHLRAELDRVLALA